MLTSVLKRRAAYGNNGRLPQWVSNEGVKFGHYGVDGVVKGLYGVLEYRRADD
jgi:hypothetical protein